jgi:hypothetical protein
MPAVRVANDSMKTAVRLPNQIASIVRKARTKSAVIMVAKPVFVELLV